MTRPVEYSLWAAIVLYLFFLPNLMNSLYSVGGILNPSWSIGVEEQFYLMWAPVVKKWHARMPQICAAVFLVSLALFTVNEINPLGLTEMKKFFAQLKFHFMAAGAFMAWLLYTNRDRLLALPIFKRRFLQWALAILLLEFIIVGVPRHWFLEESLQVLLYSWLIVEVGVNSNRLVKIKTRATEWLGEISYGIYMYHMIAIHATSYLFQKSTWWQGHLMLYFVSYYLIAVGLTILLSYLSYLLFESPILRLKQRFAR
jgi:peptidoglycan/LPS O-acetylase OafA/YrhL